VAEPAAAAGPGRRRAPRGQGEQLRGELLTAAMDLLAETGDEAAVSLRAVAQRVGVSVPSIYLHFADKKALLDAVCQQVFVALHARLQEADADADDPFDALRRQGNAYVHFALENPEHYRIVMMTEHAPAPESVDGLIAGDAFGYLVASVRRCLEIGIFEGDADEIALGLWAAAHGVAALLIAKPYFPWPERDAFIDRTICMAGIGLAAVSRLDPDNALSNEEVVARFERLRD
jgi:AcrR family transcriptional regulator